MTTIFENDLIKVSTTGRDYDFIAIIDNKTDGQICIHYDEPGYNDNYDPILVAPNDWIGLLADDEGRDWLKAIENNQIYVVTDDDEISYYPMGCSMTQWNEDCEEITNQVERVWWVVYDRYKQEFSSLTCFRKYKTKKDCQWAIDNKKEVM